MVSDKSKDLKEIKRAEPLPVFVHEGAPRRDRRAQAERDSNPVSAGMRKENNMPKGKLQMRSGVNNVFTNPNRDDQRRRNKKGAKLRKELRGASNG